MRLALVMLAGCGGGAWRPIVFAEPPVDPKAQPIAAEFPDGVNGTRLVLAVLAQAKAAEATGLSKLEIQVGACTRDISMTPQRVDLEVRPELDRITLRVSEVRIACTRVIDQELSHAPTDHGSKPGFGDVEMVTRDSCDQVPIDHVVTRYRFEVDHQFTPPDFDEIARVMNVRLDLSTPHCGTSAKNEIRAVVHHASGPAPRTFVPAPSIATTVIDLASRAAAAQNPGAATELALQGIAAIATSDPMAGLDDARATALAERIAAIYFYAIEADVDTFLHRTLPADPNATWARDLGADIDRIATRYERIKDLVRLPDVEKWLRAGALRLAAIHDHTAGLLDAAKQPAAAEAERTKARALELAGQPTR